MLLKYRGQYRVIYETDKKTGKPLEFTFIPCRIRKGANICRYDDNTLNVYLPGMSPKKLNPFLEKYPKFRVFQQGDSECTLLFNESDIEEAAHILKAWTKGRAFSPRSRTKNARFV